MLQGVERQPAALLRRIVAEAVRGETVAEFVEGDTDDRGDKPLNKTEKIAEIKAVQYCLRGTDRTHPQYKVILPKERAKNKSRKKHFFLLSFFTAI